MTPFEIMLQCEICSDYRQYQAAVHDTENIASRMRDIIYLLSEKAKDKNVPHRCRIRPLDVDGTHPHFMCGQCHKAGNELVLAETELKCLLIKAACLLQDVEDPEACREILHLLQGRYPVTYDAFQSEMDRIERKE